MSTVGQGKATSKIANQVVSALFPQRLFHGAVREFDTFQPGHENGFTLPRTGVYLTDDLVTCREFGHLIYEVDCEVRQPFDARSPRDDQTWEVLYTAAQAAGGRSLEVWQAAEGNPARFVAQGGAQTPEFILQLQAMGFDGMIFCDSWGRRGFESFVVFDPQQARIVSMRDLRDCEWPEILDYDWDSELPSPRP